MIHTELQSIVHFPVPCPSCGRERSETVRWLVTHRETTCRGCKGHIDLATDHWDAIIKKFLAVITDIQVLYDRGTTHPVKVARPILAEDALAVSLAIAASFGVSRQIVGDVEPGDLFRGEDMALGREVLGVIEAADGNMDPAGITLALVGQGRAAIAAEAPPDALG
jgi:hypothetical protein